MPRYHLLAIVLGLLLSADVAAQYPGRLPAEVRSTLSITYYDVDGPSPQALAQAMRTEMERRTGHAFYGLTRWNVRADYKMLDGSGPCRLIDVVVHLQTEIILPRWTTAAAAHPQVRDDWRAFVDALERHERNHHRMIEEMGAELGGQLSRQTASSCALMPAAAQRTMQEAVRQAEARNNTYDRNTNHGRTEGAIWPAR